MFAMIRRTGAGALVALAVASGCVGSEAEENATQETQLALANEKVIVDRNGRKWKNNGKVAYTDMRYEDLEREVSATARLDAPGLSLANLEELSDDEAVQLMQPRMEFGNTEFLMEEEDVRGLVRILREAKNARKARTARGVSTGEDGASMEDDAVGDGVNGVSQGLIISGDQRANNNYRANQYPYSLVGLGHLKASPGVPEERWCTCFKMLNDYTCITAGHCHWLNGSWQKRRPITFQAGSSSPRTELPAGCYNRTTWYSGGDDHSYDIAVLQLRGNGAWCPTSGYTGGWFGWNEPVSGNMDTWTAGYPATPPFGWSYPTQTHQSSALTSVAEVGWYLAYTHDTTGGQSGAPVVTTWSSGGYRVRGSHWGAPYASANRNHGIAMWSEIVNLLKGEAGF